jgi:ubiquinone/menaquinone biosynthesis C-methylase UbiE
VVGVDQSPEMLDVARAKLPTARFELGSLEQLPFDDGEFDLAVVSLALCHLDDPTAALTELARVVRTGGHVVVTDPHPVSEILGGQAFYGGFVDGRPMHWVRNRYHSASTWLRSFGLAGLTVENCVEEPFSDEQIVSFPVSVFYPDATLAALSGLPSLWVWELRVSERS